MLKRSLFLIHYLNFKPDEVLGLVFNRKAREELERRIKQYEHEAGLPSRGAFKILTFDALAYNLVKPQSTLLTDAGQRKLIKDIVLNAIDNEEGLSKQVEELMISSFKGDWEKTIRLNSVSSQLDLERLRSFLTEETLDGKEVKSRPEKRIADFLFEHDIPYRYEMPFIVDDGNIIRPDFYLPTFRVVIEYYGLRGDTDYEKSIEYKRQYWTYRNDIILIEINPGFICKSETNFVDSRDDDYQALCNLLTESTKHTNSTIQPKRLTDEEIIAKLRDRIRLTFVELLQSAITRAGQMNCSDIDLIEQIAQYKASSDEERSFLDLLSKFIVMYRDRLANNNLTDYNEIKKEAIGKIVDGMTELDWDRGSNGINLRSVKHIFVDEFQDFSELFRGILLAILKAAPEAVVNAVGDDWQMINRFAGSKPELFDQFDRDYPKPQTVYLQTNYRSSGGIVEFCNAIMKANGVNGKPAIPCDSKRADCFKISRLDRDQITITPREDHYFNGDCILSSIFRIYKPLTEQFRADSKTDGDRICLAISRSNNPPVQVVPDELGIRASNNRETINKMVDRLTPDNISQFFEAITEHKSKGLEADAVIVLQPKQYPMIRKRSVFLQFFGDSPANLLRDELNLFYVICSRAIQDLYFLPESEQMMSLFALSLQGSITALSWDDFPCRLSGPAALHTILVQNGNRDSAALFAAKDMLLGLGFDVFSRPKKIPTRSQLVRQDLYGTLKLLHKTVQSCHELDLKYIIKDGLNHQVFCFPGPQSIQEAMNQLQDAR